MSIELFTHDGVIKKNKTSPFPVTRFQNGFELPVVNTHALFFLVLLLLASVSVSLSLRIPRTNEFLADRARVVARRYFRTSIITVDYDDRPSLLRL